ncbi:5-oxoprolinase subunit PxpA [Marixanthomonas spongiae]|uniref:Lactam utilization protein LamB n=1 Tax=Marixanthomonas spongiae TaxID=2174845 RepID=A0A2U0I115_9FLAO|nr:5-oxoprolinase subunit PxpA [Marixanthomonas spongiae]PVW14803.1 lactam utilization protein LamB [Marixanthomonas spongiae]
MKHIDINADLGEGSGFDKAIMPLIASCSIACGGHYGNESTMRTAIQLAKKYDVKIGAHPSFPDKDNFGRKIITMTKKELTATVFNQLLHFLAVCETEEATIHHIKLHGALYNYAAKDAPTADAVVEAIVQTKVRPKLYVQYNSVLHRKAENLLPLEFEAFIDRRYNDDLSLVSRSEPGALIEKPRTAWKQLFTMVSEEKVTTASGIAKPINASTYCIHSDNQQSVEILQYIHNQMKNNGLTLNR